MIIKIMFSHSLSRSSLSLLVVVRAWCVRVHLVCACASCACVRVLGEIRLLQLVLYSNHIAELDKSFVVVIV